MSNITGEASQNRCLHLAPTAASSHSIRGVPGRTLPCSCLKLSEQVNKKPPQQRLETFGCCCRRLHILWNKAQHPGAGARHAGVAGEGLGGLCKWGRLCHAVVFGVKQAQSGGGCSGWVSQLGGEQGHGSSTRHGCVCVCLCHPSPPPALAGALAAFPCWKSSSQGGIFHAGILALGARSGGAVYKWAPGSCPGSLGSSRCPFLQ